MVPIIDTKAQNGIAEHEVAGRHKDVNRRPRIGVDLLILSQYNLTGIVTYARTILAPLIQEMHYCDWVFYVKRKEDLPFAADSYPNIEVKCSSWMKSPWLWKLLGTNILALTERLDLLFVPVSRLPLVRRCAAVCYIHDLGYLTMPEFLQKGTVKRTATAIRHACRVADSLLVGSEFTKNELIKHYKVPSEKISVVHYGFDDQLNAPSRDDATEVLERYGIQKPYVLYLGVIQGRKNLVKLIEAASEWRKKKSNLQLVLAGRRGWNCDEIYEAANRYSRTEVNMTGPIQASHVRMLFEQAECFVLPSLYEGFGIPVLEAMACGAPVVLSSSAALPETGGDAAEYFDPMDPNSIAEKVLEVVSSPNLRSNLIERGRNRVTKFTWVACAQRTVPVFEKLLSRQPSR